MGGDIAWTLRTEAGDEFRMQVWTNSVPMTIQSPAFLAGEPAAIEAAVAPWLAHKADSEANRDGRTFADPASGCLAPYPYGLKPSEYGLIVTCFKTKRILSWQNYSTLGRAYPTSLRLGMERTEESFGTRMSWLRALDAAGRIKTWVFTTHEPLLIAAFMALEGTVAHPHEHDGTTVFEVHVPGRHTLAQLEAIASGFRKPLVEVPQAVRAMGFPDLPPVLAIDDDQAEIDLSPMVLEAFPGTHEGALALLDRLEALDFAISAKERSAWHDRFRALKAAEA